MGQAHNSNTYRSIPLLAELLQDKLLPRLPLLTSISVWPSKLLREPDQHGPWSSTRCQGLQNRPVRSNRRPPVAVYRTSLTGNQWKPVEFKSKFKSTCVTGSDRYTDRFVWFTGPVWPVTGVLTKKSDSLKVVPRCEIKENFGLTYAHINVKDRTKAIIYNHAYKYNSNKLAYKYHSHNRAYTDAHK